MARIFGNQSGLTLIETISVLIIGALIIGGTWIGYAQIRMNDQVNRTIAVMDQTIQVTRDFLASRNTASAKLSRELVEGNMMPSDLTYKGVAGSNTTTVLSGYNPTDLISGEASAARIFTSPLGHDFFVQYPDGARVGPLIRFFEIRIGFVDTGTQKLSAQCMQLLPKIIGSKQMMSNRGLVGYWYGDGDRKFVLTNAAATLPAGLVPGNELPTFSDLSATDQQTHCLTAKDIRLYFSMTL